jgi:4-aminobutyrate aminotransferase / (S)-3-amino-2-methylpropionate transaminase / 5-aminovalerate transaminase
VSGWKFDLTPIAVPKVETSYRRIVTKMPVPESIEILLTLDECESRAMHGQLPIVWDRAEGFQVHDAWGNTWIDFTSTIFVTNAGHGNPRIIKALREQLDKPLLHTYTFASKVRADYIRHLIDVTPAQFEKAFLLSAGTEATECGLKLMRMHAWKAGKKRPGIIAFEGNWHGRTLGAQMMSYSPAQKEWIGFTDPNIYHLPFPYPWREDARADPRGYFRKSINALMDEHRIDPDKDLCGFILEVFQGWAAAFYPPEFVQEVAAFARDHGMLLAFDEMQSGFGRTGKLFGYMHYGVEPDLLCCGKGASSGLPLAVVLGSKEIMDLPEIGSMSSTHSANPLVCAAGLANLHALLDDGLIDNSRVLGEVFHARLNAIKDRFPGQIRTVLGAGLVAGVIFVTPEDESLVDLANRISQEAMRRGLLVVHTGRESIKLAPPLSITEAALLEGLAVFEEVITDCLG